MEQGGSYQEMPYSSNTRHAESTTTPSNQVASLLDELRKHYRLSDKPPFATNIPLGKERHRPGDIRRVVLATDDGSYPHAHVRHVDLVYRKWNNRYMFATIEFNGSLHIVKCVAGGLSSRSRGEAPFKHWQSPQNGFSKIPSAWEDRGPISATTEGYQLPPSAWSTVPAARNPIRKKILRASKPLRHSQANEEGDSYNQPAKDACSGEAIFFSETSNSDSSSSSDEDEDCSSVDVIQAKSSKDGIVKAEPNDSHLLLTPATAISTPLSSAQRVTSPHAETLDPRIKANGLQPAAIDRLLVQLRDDGKTFEEIQNHFRKMTGEVVSMSTWYSRYNRIKGVGRTLIENNTGRLEDNKTLKRSRKISTSSDADHNADDDTNDETDEVESWRESAKRVFQTSQVAQPFFIPQAAPTTTKNGNLRRRAPIINPKAVPRGLPTSMEEACEADKMLLHMKNVQHKPWVEIRETWTAMTGQQTAGSTLPNRYNRLRANLMPAPPPRTPAKNRKSHQTDAVPAGDPSPEPVAKSTTSSMPTLASHKLNRTTLRIVHSGSFTPLKLRSCKTISELFDSVASICDLSQTTRRRTVSTLKATFSWIPENDSSRTVLLKEGFGDSFEFLLETIDEAPCWETEDGKCTVHVEVVHRNISGEAAGEGSIGKWPATDVAYTPLLQHLGT